MKTLLAIDGNSILNRAFYGVRPLTTKDGFPTNALYGMVNIIEKQREALSPDFCAVAFDLKAPTFRHKLFDAYKAGRKPMPDDLRLQFPVAKELLTALGYHILEQEGYEADDILGTLAKECGDGKVRAYLLTGDRDALQLIDANTHVLLATNTDTIDMDEEKFFDRYGVPSNHFVDVKALMGDSSDNIPGVPGVGEKTALSLIAKFGTLDSVYEHLTEAGSTPSLLKKLEEGKESAYLSRTLATICKTVPLPEDLSDLAYFGIDQAKARELFLKLEFSGFLKRFSLDQAVKVEIEMPKEVSCDKKELSTRLAACSLLSLDWRKSPVTVCDGKELFSIDVPLSDLLPILKEKKVVLYDCKGFFAVTGIESKEFDLFDLQLAAYLVNASKGNYAFSTLVSDYLGEVYDRDGENAFYSMRLYEKILAKLEESGQAKLLCELEIPLARVLASMEKRGFFIDRKGIAAYGEQLDSVAESLKQQIYFHAGKEFNIGSPKQLGDVLFETLGLPHGKKSKTGYSTNAEILEKLRPYHPIVEEVLDYRQLTKLKSTYVEGLLKVADSEGRVHSNFKQTGTATGRLSSSDPNLQNIPVRTELGRELRRYFLPQDPNYVLIDADYSQIELRLLAHISGDENMIAAFQSGEDIHTSTAATVFGVPKEAVTSEMRKRAKAVNFGILYGIGAFSLSDDLHVTRQKAQEYIDQYLASYPGIDLYLKETIKSAYEVGFVTTMFGRRRYIPELAGTNKVLQKFGERVAMNSPIQGSAADLIKIAMIRVYERLQKSGLDAHLILQVHDELILEAHKDCANEAAKILKEEMEGAYPDCKVPLTVDLHIGKTWFEAK
ncbi:MAG: DNA polymerase I [Clostridia bacterium]|nr:DNA polymerase I [Clostridia bacterium]